MKKIPVLVLGALMLFPVSPAFAATYDLYLFAGQSNMDGRGAVADLTTAQRRPLDNVIIYYRNPPHSTDGWKSFKPGFSIAPKYKGGLPSPTFGPEVGFAFALTKAQPERKFAFIKGSKGGTSLAKDWAPGVKDQPDTQGPCYRDFIETIRLAKAALAQAGDTFTLRGLLWHQGESDSKSSTDVYQLRLTQFITRLRADLDAPDLAVVVGEVFDNGNRDTVRAALRAIGTSGPRFGLASAEGTRTSDPGTHFDAASQLLLGQRFADAMLKITRAQP